MAYIIDGNNVMGQVPGWHRDKPRSQRGLIEELAKFTRAKKMAVTAVFDGAPIRDVPDGSAFNGVKVLYAERGSDADSKIERLVDSSTNPKGLTVITSDRHLAFLVISRGASVVRSGEFRKELKRLLESQPQNKDPEQNEVGDINGWLRYFGSLPEDDDAADE